MILHEITKLKDIVAHAQRKEHERITYTLRYNSKIIFLEYSYANRFLTTIEELNTKFVCLQHISNSFGIDGEMYTDFIYGVL